MSVAASYGAAFSHAMPNLGLPWVAGAVARTDRNLGRNAREYLEVALAIAAVSIAGCFVPLGYEALGHIYLFAVIALSLRVGRWPALFAALGSAVAWDFVFLPPRLSFSVLDLDDGLLLGTYFVVALAAGQLTSRIRAHEREQHHHELLAASDRLHRALLDGVAHELKTPLAVLLSASERLVSSDPATGRVLIGEVRIACRRLERVISNLLGQTRIESGALRPESDWCDAHDLIALARDSIGDALAGRTITIEIPADFPLFRADTALMEQVLANLLLNAARHTPAGTAVRVAAGIEGSRIFIAISDNGPGISPDVAATLFEKFQTGGRAGTGGLGLGLSIVSGFMHAQGGAVAAGNMPGGGACFTVYLPRAENGGVPGDDS